MQSRRMSLIEQFANIGIAAVGCAVTSMALPLMFFAQLGRGLTPTQAALITVSPLTD